jgi:hypothetical protein
MNKKYGSLMILVSVIVVVIYTLWVPASYLLNGGNNLILNDILPDPIWGLIIPVYLLILITAFLFGWIGWNIICGPPQEDTSIKEL